MRAFVLGLAVGALVAPLAHVVTLALGHHPILYPREH